MPHVVEFGLTAPGIDAKGPDFWNVDIDVRPNPRIASLDVMLVQCLLVAIS